jgi:hypothetical protein
MKREKAKPGTAISPADYAALREFFSSYLHEDFRDEYGSPSGAVRAFRGDGSNEEIAQVRNEWTRLRNILRGKPITDFQEALRKLGSGWQPQEEEELSPMDNALADKKPH